MKGSRGAFIISQILAPYYKWPHLVTYCCFGIITAGIDIAIFTYLVEIVGVYYIISNCISVFIGICVSFILNSRYNFKVTDDKAKRFTVFLIVGLCGIAMSNVLLYVLIDLLGIYYLFAKLVTLVSVSLCKFTVNKFVTFKIKNE